MLNASIMEYCKTHNYLLVDESAVRNIDGVYISFVQKKSLLNVTFDMNNMRAIEDEVREKLQYHREMLRALKVTASFDFVTVSFRVSKKLPEHDSLDLLINTVLKVAKENNARFGGQCATCGTDVSQGVMLRGHVQNVCDRCVANINEDAAVTNPTHYLAGLFGAIVGAIIGAMPWFITSRSGYIIRILPFLVGPFSFKLYMLFKGARKKVYINFVAYTASISVIILMNFIVYAFEWIRFDGRLIIEYAPFIFDYVVEENLIDIIISLIIGVLGLLSARKKVNEYAMYEKLLVIPNADVQSLNNMGNIEEMDIIDCELQEKAEDDYTIKDRGNMS